MVYDGKTYRNLQDQVAYLTAKWQELADEIDAVRAQIPSKMIVEELPEIGDPNITYYVGPKGTEPNLYYEVWVWVQEEPEGPFVWRELEDTDQVDLSGYLPIQNSETTDAQAYIKNADGTQGMVDVVVGTSGGSIVKRTSNGQVSCGDATDDNHAVNRGFANQNYRGKMTSVTEKDQAYVKFANGTQGANDIDLAATGYTIPKRYSNGTMAVAYAGSQDPDNRATNIGYCNDHYLAKQTATSSFPQAYGKNADGTQGMVEYSVTVRNAAIVQRNASGQILVPNTPTDGSHAASKAYVDAAVGQLLYLHRIEILVAIGLTSTLKIVANLVNGSPTAITSITSDTFVRMNVQYGAILEEGQPATPVSVVKHPTRFIYDSTDAPSPGYAYTIENLGSPITNFTTDAMTTTVTDTVISW